MKTKTLLLILFTYFVLNPTLGQNMIISPSPVNIGSAAGSTATVTITSTVVNWNIFNLPVWLSASPSTGTGDGTITFTTLSDNPSLSSATAYLTISGNGGGEYLQVVRAGSLPSISVSPQTINLPDILHDVLISVTSNTTWSLTGIPYWIKTTLTSYTGNANVVIWADYSNPLPIERSATLTFSVPGVTKTVTVTQPAGSPTLDLYPSSLVLSGAANSSSTFNLETNATWNITGIPSWFTCKSSGAGDEIITVTTNAVNTGNDVLTATLTITAEDLTKNITITQEPNFAVSRNQVTFSSNGYTDPIKLYSSKTWSIASSESWCIVGTTTGTGSKTISLSAPSNPNAVARTATITITTTEATPQTLIVNVTQDAGPAIISTSANSLSIGATQGSTTSFDITSNNASWAVSSNASWLTPNTTNGSNNATITLTAGLNPTVTTRSATITISATGALSKQIYVTQAAGPATFSVDKTAVGVGAAYNSTNTFNVTSNTYWTASHSEKSFWLYLNNYSGSTYNNTGNLTVTVSAASANPNAWTRTDTITLTVTGLPAQKVIVTQDAAAPTLSVLSNSFTVGAVTSTTARLSISSNTLWTVSSNQSWLKPNVTSGSKNVDVTLTADVNSYAVARTATVTVSATGVNSQIITVTQQAANPTLTVSSSAITVPPVAGSTVSFDISSNTSWNISSNQSWLTSNVGSGLNNGTITLTAAANTNTTSRTATITVSAAGMTAKTITITQLDVNAVFLSISQSTLNLNQTAITSNIQVSSNVSWTAVSSATWLTLGTASGSGNGEVVANSSANNTTLVRTATITVSATGVTSQVITVTQNASGATVVSEVNNYANIIYPNPVWNEVNIRLSPENLPANIAVYNINGQQLRLVQATGSLTTLDMKGYAPGIYILRIITPAQMIKKQIMKL